MGPSIVQEGFARTAKGEMPYRTLGRSGERVSLMGLGNYHIGIQPAVEESLRIVRTAVDNGINPLASPTVF